jgi:hypothetical protein
VSRPRSTKADDRRLAKQREGRREHEDRYAGDRGRPSDKALRRLAEHFNEGRGR